MTTVRHLTIGESQDPHLLPPELRGHGLPFLDPEWCWVVEHDGQPIALFVSSFVHGLLVFWRLMATAKAKRVSVNWFLLAFPQILDTVKQRGCVGYMTMLQDGRPQEAKLARMVMRHGGLIEPFSGSLAVRFFPEYVSPEQVQTIVEQMRKAG